MSIKIGQSPEISVTQAANSAAQKVAQQPSSAETANASAAKSTREAGVAVTVSTLARSLESTEGANSADIDTQKVADVRSAIQDGTYVVNPEAIADKLLSNAQEMLNRTKN